MFVMLASLAIQQPQAVDPTEAPLAERMARIETCLTTTGVAQPSQCIGVISDPCMETPEGGSTLGMNACLAAETEAWESLMGRWLDQALADPELSEDGRRGLLAGQEAWNTARNESLKAYDGRRGTVYQIISGGWWRDWTAQRALWLNDLAVGPVG